MIFPSIMKIVEGRTDRRTTCAKIMITTGRDSGSDYVDQFVVYVVYLENLFHKRQQRCSKFDIIVFEAELIF